MRVTRIEIFGFKSFVERFVLNFDRNIIGIVGPNGCGKSNIVDAFRWVLGETHARQLRGNSLEDLIFNGSDSRRPLGMAEVSITIRPDAGWLQTLPGSEPLAGDEALPGEVEFEPGENLSAAPTIAEAGDANLEEHAGDELEPGDNQLAESAHATSLVPPALLEIPGLFDAAEIQLTRRLYRSGESEYFINRVPCRLRDMIDIYRLIGLGSRGLSIVQQGQIGQLISKKPTERRELLEEAAGISSFRARMETAQRKLERTAENVARLKDISTEVDKQVRNLKRQAARARTRNELKASLTESELALYSLRNAMIARKSQSLLQEQESRGQELSGHETALRVEQAREEAERAEITELDTELVRLRRNRDELYKVLTRERERMQEMRVEVARAESRSRSVEENVQRLARRDVEIAAELEMRAGTADEAQTLLERREAEKAGTEEALLLVQQKTAAFSAATQGASSAEAQAVESELTGEIQRLSQEVEQLSAVSERIRVFEQQLADVRAERQEREKLLQKDRVKHAGLESEIRSIERQVEALAEHAAKSFVILGEQQLEGKSASLDSLRDRGLLQKVLAAGIKVPEDLQRPLAAILGERGNYVVSSDPEVLGRDYQLDTDARVGIIARDPQLPGSAVPFSPQEFAAVPGASMLLSALDVEPEMQAAVNALLGEIVLVSTLDEAFTFNAHNRAEGRPQRTIVTRQGEVVTPWGWYTTQAKGLGFSFTRRIDELRADAERLEKNTAQLESQVAGYEVQITDLRATHAKEVSEKERLIQLQRNLAQLLQQEKEAERRKRQLDLEEERRRREAQLLEERQAQAVVRAAVSELAQARNALEQEQRGIQRLHDEKASLETQRWNLQEEQSAIAAELTRLSEALERSTSGDLQAEFQTAKQGFDQIEAQISDVESKRGEISIRLADAAQSVAEYRRVTDRLSREHGAAELALEKLVLEQKMIREEMLRQYESELLPEEHASFAELDLNDEEAAKRSTALQEEALKIRRRLEREGEVDPQAIELYEQESERLGKMLEQLADLETASRTLDRTIRQLKDISRKRFLETFEDVRVKFAELIPRLFGGGAGQLELINPEDPLTSGVDMTVRPPGKKISSMDLLSGGEKALVATAVLIAMFLHRPSPICVLDEVDAPLDEANLERYLGLIREISVSTQFLIITHNKTTMSAVDRLVGITMQESGVSNALSVTLAEAEEELERWAANQ